MLSTVTMNRSRSLGSSAGNDDEDDTDNTRLRIDVPSNAPLPPNHATTFLDQSDSVDEEGHHEKFSMTGDDDDDDDDGMMRPPPWEERSSRPKSILLASARNVSKDTTVATSNHRMRKKKSRLTSRDHSASAVTFQLHQEATSQDLNMENNMYYTSESDEGVSNLSGRQQQVLEISTASTASEATAISVTPEQYLVDPSAALNFAIEHRIFLKASLDLLTELDLHAPELGMMDPIVLKAGALKKASHLMNGVWKVKYVEIRRGMFSYYENAVSNAGSRVGDPQGELLLRKNIPLEASTCTCRAVKLHQKALNFSPGGAIFELACNNNSSNKRLWMASSREERQAWMQAINNAMVGGSVTRGDSLIDHRGIVRTVSDRSPFKNDLRKYLKHQSLMRGAKTSQEYLTGFRELLNQSLYVPVKWIAKQGMLSNDNIAGYNSTAPNAFQEATVAMSIDQLWRDLQRDSVSINGKVYRGDSSHGPERILGALTSRILSVGRSSEASGARSDLRESKALVYARDLLLAGNRTRSGGDSYYCVNMLCSNADLAVVVPSGMEAEPVSFDVSEDDSDESFHTRFNDKSGWVKTRSKLQRSWRKHFFVLSEGTLSYYEGATPRPHGLRGQRVVADASISITKRKAKENGNLTNHDEFLLTISLKDGTTKDRLLLFESEDKLLDWVYALECVTKAKPSSEVTRKVHRRLSGSNDEQTTYAYSMVDILNEAQKSTLEHALKLGLDPEQVSNRLANFAQRATSAVRVSISACTEYKVCTINPQGDDEHDTWVTIRADFLQAFRITGANGILRGEEIVRLSIVNCINPLLQPLANSEAALSPSTMRARINRRIFRNPSVGEEGEGVLSD